MTPIKRITVSLLLVGLAATAWCASSPLRRSTAVIERRILRATPLGTSFQQVEAYVRHQEWHVDYASRTTGFLFQEAGQPSEVVGDQSIRAHLGYYWAPLRVDVTVFWAFDPKGRLIRVWAWKTIDSV